MDKKVNQNLVEYKILGRANKNIWYVYFRIRIVGVGNHRAWAKWVSFIRSSYFVFARSASKEKLHLESALVKHKAFANDIRRQNALCVQKEALLQVVDVWSMFKPCHLHLPRSLLLQR